MATARDQVEAYNFAVRRQILALLQGDDSVAVDPRRRLNRALIGGALLAVVLLAAVGVAGLLSNSASATLPDNGVAVTSDGSVFVIVDHVVHPALNLASAELVGGSSVTTVSSGALAKAPRGLPIGIPNAPDALPPASSLVTGRWTVCSTAPPASAARAQIVLSLGAPAPTPLPNRQGVVVQTGDGTTWLLDAGRRYAMSSTVSQLLQVDSQPVPLDEQVLDLVPEGPQLYVPKVPETGSTASLPFPAKVGDLVLVDYGSGTPGHYVVMSDGVAPVNAFTFALLAGSAPDPTLHEPASDIVNHAASAGPDVPGTWPNQALQLAPPPAGGSPLCFTYDPHGPQTGTTWTTTISEPATAPVPAGAQPVSATSGTLPTVLTGVAVPPGRGALVRAAGTGGTDAVITLVTDSGLRYSIASSDDAGKLGYAAASAVTVPLPFVDLLPAGPGLSSAVAAEEFAGGPSAPVAPTPTDTVSAGGS